VEGDFVEVRCGRSITARVVVLVKPRAQFQPFVIAVSLSAFAGREALARGEAIFSIATLASFTAAPSFAIHNLKNNLLQILYLSGCNRFFSQYNYSYTVDATGLLKLTKTTQNGNAALIATHMNNIFSFTENDQFKINGISTSVGFLGQLTSVQTPTFYFRGNLY